jgi:WD40 repeat protein
MQVQGEPFCMSLWDSIAGCDMGRFVSCGDDTVRVWDTKSMAPVQTLKAHEGEVRTPLQHPWVVAL